MMDKQPKEEILDTEVFGGSYQQLLISCQQIHSLIVFKHTAVNLWLVGQRHVKLSQHINDQVLNIGINALLKYWLVQHILHEECSSKSPILVATSRSIEHLQMFQCIQI